MTKPDAPTELIAKLLERRKQWIRLYPSDYIKRHFSLYDGELEALLDLAAMLANGRLRLSDDRWLSLPTPHSVTDAQSDVRVRPCNKTLSGPAVHGTQDQLSIPETAPQDDAERLPAEMGLAALKEIISIHGEPMPWAEDRTQQYFDKLQSISAVANQGLFRIRASQRPADTPKEG